ncbi:MAG: hypothetical protein MJA83_15470, partial [Gammaproteobacteria bacterium]|nr:hypothetical protein [Gammaproteobacteria bacterium]
MQEPERIASTCHIWPKNKPPVSSSRQEQAPRLTFQPIVHLPGNGEQHYEIRVQPVSDRPDLPVDLIFEHAAQNASGEKIDR